MEKEMLQEFEKKFAEAKKKLGFSSSLDELDRYFFVRDTILREEFISQSVVRQVRDIITEFYININNYLHSLIMPNPQNILNLSESKIFDSDARKEIMLMMQKIMELTSRNMIITLSSDDKSESKFLDDSLELWKKEIELRMVKILRKINMEWAKQQ